VLDRDTDSITSTRNLNTIPEGDRIRTITIAGLVGVINLIAGPYLIVIKSRIRVGEINKHVVWQMNQFELIPFHRSTLYLNENQTRYNQSYIDMINTVLSTEYFYFSYSYDISLNVQALDYNPPDFFQQSMIDRADERFVWNGHALHQFRRNPEFRKFCLPLIHGCM
jgi:hypothetical protein